MSIRLLFVALCLGPFACSFEAPQGPPRVATSDLRVAADADIAGAFLGHVFDIPNAGAAIAPEFAGQPIGVRFVGGRSPVARVMVAGATFETAVTFAPCEFRVLETSYPNPTSVRIGDRFSVGRCEVVVGTSGLPTTSSGEQRPVQLVFGAASSTPALFRVRVERDGGVFVWGVSWSRVGTVGVE